MFFITTVLLSVIFAYVLRLRCSGAHLGYGLLLLCFTYNIFFVTYYLRIIDRAYFLFFGHHPEFLSANPIVGWVCLIGAVLHCGAMPSKREPRSKQRRLFR
ncbi:hypothetical protein P0Y43_08380 [Pseudomonas entomophila]|uniref:hypothetical protein n=1 Tax=Pseudomonas entomophila TaxID=312306 RepID=UPI0023D7D363|nr:hypothetical protein [Pseudomonas entomophila]MDF0730747.1 hypothetical protein [Pseudomonas entomophila]